MRKTKMRVMTLTRSTAVLACLLTWAAGAAFAGTEGRIIGTVTDPAGNPLEGVKVTVSAPEVDLHSNAETNGKGRFTITLLNASHVFVIQLEKEGFQILQQPIDPKIGGTVKPDYILEPGATIAPEKLAELQAQDRSAKVYNEGARKFGAGDIEGALESFLESLVENPEQGLAHLAVARIFLSRDDFAGGLPHAEKAHELVPEEELSQMVLLDALWGLEQFERALPLLDEMVGMGKAPEKVAVRVYNAGARNVRLGEIESAQTRFEQVLELDPTLVPAHLTLAQITLNSGDYEAALHHAKTYSEAEPDNATALSLLYRIYTLRGEQELAEAAFDRMAGADAEMVASTFFAAGVEHFNAGRNLPAMEAFRRVLKAEPENVDAMYYMGLSSASNGEIPLAVEYLEKFIALAPEHPEVPSARAMLDGLQ